MGAIRTAISLQLVEPDIDGRSFASNARGPLPFAMLGGNPGLASNNFDAGRAKARDVMTEGIHCCREDDKLAKAVHHMEMLKVRRLPGINKGKRVRPFVVPNYVQKWRTRHDSNV